MRSLISTRPRKVALITLVLAGIAGLAIAAFLIRLRASGDVTTLNAKAIWDAASGATTTDSETRLGEADLATCTASVASDGSVVTFSLGKAYDGYDCTVSATARNNGNEALKVQSIELTDGRGTDTTYATFVPGTDFKATIPASLCGTVVNVPGQTGSSVVVPARLAALKVAAGSKYRPAIDVVFVPSSQYVAANCTQTH